MILYHGSGTIVAEPIIVPSQKLCDFGLGFYQKGVKPCEFTPGI